MTDPLIASGGWCVPKDQSLGRFSAPLPGHGEHCFLEDNTTVLCNCGKESVVIQRSPYEDYADWADAERDELQWRLDTFRQSAGEHIARLHDEIQAVNNSRNVWRVRAIDAERRATAWIWWSALSNSACAFVVTGYVLGWW